MSNTQPRDSLEEVEDLESGVLSAKVGLGEKSERTCRICHLDSERSHDEQGDNMVIQLGCSCKGDLASAHRICAETWFKIKGNMDCEICGDTARNAASEETDQANCSSGATQSPAAAISAAPVTRNFRHGRRILNFLLGGMIFAFLISWLFHFKVLK